MGLAARSGSLTNTQAQYLILFCAVKLVQQIDHHYQKVVQQVDQQWPKVVQLLTKRWSSRWTLSLQVLTPH